MRPQALTIAGSDSSGGAGIQADLKTFIAFGVYGASVITAITAQNTTGVRAIHAIPTDMVTAQLEAVMEDLDIKAVKTGMLPNVECILAIAAEMKKHPGVPLVVDPVLISTSGCYLSDPKTLSAMREILLPLAVLVTPNLQEAQTLTGIELKSEDDWVKAGENLLSTGVGAVLLKGGHSSDEVARDMLFTPEGPTDLFARRCQTRHGHGTGCTLSAAIAAGLAKGLPLPEAVFRAKNYLTTALEHAFEVGAGPGPVDHAVGMESRW
ncbi:MAG: bifunctional hydroxymethylpyrimidine kinase/phosphomethylpyrimidine kinase [Firmicutes bacterium]|nr:bifunctional hydroxymethylpyrimidine kinase/phosphomethylpyrimidine kinase [Bacillota bacterium]